MRAVDEMGLEIHEISAEEARELLTTFVVRSSEAFESGAATDGMSGFAATFTKQSVLDYFSLAIERTNFVLGPEPIVPLKADPRSSKTLPRSASPYPDSFVWLTRMGYYFGESLVRSSNHLTWSIGAEDTALENMPVVSGFPHDLEAAVIMISRNLAKRVRVDSASFETVERAIEHWFGWGAAPAI